MQWLLASQFGRKTLLLKSLSNTNVKKEKLGLRTLNLKLRELNIKMGLSKDFKVKSINNIYSYFNVHNSFMMWIDKY